MLYALPGNHDWYDGLTAFLRVFARREAHVGARQTAQTRSYFALRLPHGWWLFAIDAQGGPIWTIRSWSTSGPSSAMRWPPATG